MKGFTILLLLVGLSSNALGQDVLDDSGAVMISPIIWGPMVYVNADKSLTEFVYGKVFDSESEVTLNCEVPNKYLWYCNKTKPVVFQGLDGQGNKTKRIFLCEKNSDLAIQKYYSEKLLSYKCGVSGGWSEEQESFYAESHEET